MALLRGSAGNGVFTVVVESHLTYMYGVHPAAAMLVQARWAAHGQMPMPLWRGDDDDVVGAVNLHRSEIEVGGMMFVDFEQSGITRADLRENVLRRTRSRRGRAGIEDFAYPGDMRPWFRWFLLRRGRFRIV